MIEDEEVIDTVVEYHVEVSYGDGVWVDMVGFMKDNEDEARAGALVLQPLCDDVRLLRVTTVVGVRKEELEL